MFEQGYAMIPRPLIYDTEVSAQAKILFCMISNLSAKQGYCWATNKYLAEQMKTTERTVTRLLSQLERYLFITEGKSYKRKINLDKNVYVPRQKRSGNLDKNVQHKYIDINKQTEIKTITKVIGKEAGELAGVLAEGVRENYSFARVEPNRWAEDIEKLHRIDGYDYEIIEAVIRWSQSDPFWKQNIRSGAKLRKQFESLLVKVKSERKRVAVIS